MSTTPDADSVEPKVQETERSNLPAGCSGRGCVFGIVVVLVLVLVMIPIRKRAIEISQANNFGFGTKWLNFAINDFVDQYGHLPPPFRYSDLAGEEAGQVFLDKYVEIYKGLYPKFEENTSWFKPGEPYLGHQIAKEPNAAAEPLWSWRMIVSSYEWRIQF